MAENTNGKTASLLCTAVAAIAVIVPAGVGWTAYQLARSRTQVEQLSKELETTRQELAQLRKDEEPLRILSALMKDQAGPGAKTGGWAELQVNGGS
ncbi:MAG: hypothetical protein JWM97_1200 [Phycisphaerales bacterium]|nr:hypothetical protein [Phycisphaerales bacterium]